MAFAASRFASVIIACLILLPIGICTDWLICLPLLLIYSTPINLSLKEYDKLKEQQHYITDKALIDIIDNMERLLRALRKHIVRTDI